MTMSTDFFDRQDRARRQTARLIVLFGLSVAAIIAVLYALALPITQGGGSHACSQPAVLDLWDPALLAVISLGVIVVVSLGSLYKVCQLAAGGSVIARMMGGRLIDQRTTDLAERRVLNVVEEMSLASGVPVPPVYVLDNEPSINAFAAGYQPEDAVVAVSRGCLQYLTREELQGVMGHEFSHVLNGDMRLNLRLVGLVYGILVLAAIGYLLMRSAGSARFSSRNSDDRRDDSRVAVFCIGLLLYVLGYLGVFLGNIIKAAISRQREFLADASSVQFTRHPGALAGALKKIAGLAQGSRVGAPHAHEVSHMFFADAFVGSFFNLFATHPPLEERIRLLEPNFDGAYPAVVAQAAGSTDQAAGSAPPRWLVETTESQAAGLALAAPPRESAQPSPPPPLLETGGSAAEERWHYERQGERCGPVSLTELRNLAASGRLNPYALVWKRGMTQWMEAALVEGLFSQPAVPPPPPPEASSPSPPPPPPEAESPVTEERWHYERQGERCEPVSFAELRHLAASGQVQPDNLVWKLGMAEWLPAAQVERLFPVRPEPPAQPAEGWYWGDGEQRHGPLSLEELRGLARSGLLRREHLVWKKGMPDWTPAGQISDLFPARPEPVARPAVQPDDLWYYGDGDQRHGPVSTEELKGLATSGQLQPDDLVWKRGMAEWSPAGQIEGLFPTQSELPDQAGVPSADAWYWFDGYRRYGPLSLGELRGFVQSGVLRRDQLVWKKGTPDSIPAGQVEDLFPAREERPASPTAQPDDLWYYGDGEQRHGPVSIDELRRLASSKQLHPDDLVWRRDMTDWTAAIDIPGIWIGEGEKPPKAEQIPDAAEEILSARQGPPPRSEAPAPQPPQRPLVPPTPAPSVQERLQKVRNAAALHVARAAAATRTNWERFRKFVHRQHLGTRLRLLVAATVRGVVWCYNAARPHVVRAWNKRPSKQEIRDWSVARAQQVSEAWKRTVPWRNRLGRQMAVGLREAWKGLAWCWKNLREFAVRLWRTVEETVRARAEAKWKAAEEAARAKAEAERKAEPAKTPSPTPVIVASEVLPSQSEPAISAADVPAPATESISAGLVPSPLPKPASKAAAPATAEATSAASIPPPGSPVPKPLPAEVAAAAPKRKALPPEVAAAAPKRKLLPPEVAAAKPKPKCPAPEPKPESPPIGAERGGDGENEPRSEPDG
jgi:Zn-dependent protease with chaperone function